MRVEWIGVAIVMGSAAIVGQGCSEEPSVEEQTQVSASPSGPQADDQREVVEATKVEVQVDAAGYEPSRVHAEAGQKLTMVFTRTADEGCGQKVVIPDLDIEKDLPLNEPVQVSFTPETAGTLVFTCGMGMYDGKIVVK